jgi:DNA-binding MarR family transcriptional regulator
VTDPLPATSRTGSKTDAVLELLNRDEGATSAELIEATGWLPHTTRAALTGLRKKGHAIERTKRGDQTCYRIAGQG